MHVRSYRKSSQSKITCIIKLIFDCIKSLNFKTAYFESPDIWWETANKTLPTGVSGLTTSVFARIGSASTRGLVFQVRTNQRDLACKLLLDTFATTTDHNKQEITFTQTLGQLAPNYFPTVHQVKTCAQVVIPTNISSGLILDSQIYNAYQALAKIDKRKAKLALIKYNQSYDPTVFGVSSDSNISGYLMFSDLGDMDLKQWARTEQPDQAWFDVIDQVFIILRFLAQQGLVHGDLHLGNIMFFGDKIKMIDLGEMHPMLPDEQTYDVDKFISNFEYLPVSTKVITYLNLKRQKLN